MVDFLAKNQVFKIVLYAFKHNGLFVNGIQAQTDTQLAVEFRRGYGGQADISEIYPVYSIYLTSYILLYSIGIERISSGSCALSA